MFEFDHLSDCVDFFFHVTETYNAVNQLSDYNVVRKYSSVFHDRIGEELYKCEKHYTVAIHERLAKPTASIILTSSF